MSSGKGLLGYGLADHPERGIAQKYDLQKILDRPLGALFELQSDVEGNIWCHEKNGLIKLDPEKFKFSFFPSTFPPKASPSAGKTGFAIA